MKKGKEKTSIRNLKLQNLQMKKHLYSNYDSTNKLISNINILLRNKSSYSQIQKYLEDHQIKLKMQKSYSSCMYQPTRQSLDQNHSPNIYPKNTSIKPTETYTKKTNQNLEYVEEVFYFFKEKYEKMFSSLVKRQQKFCDKISRQFQKVNECFQKSTSQLNKLENWFIKNSISEKSIENSFASLYSINNNLYNLNVKNFLNQEQTVKKYVTTLNDFYIQNFELLNKKKPRKVPKNLSKTKNSTATKNKQSRKVNKSKFVSPEKSRSKRENIWQDPNLMAYKTDNLFNHQSSSCRRAQKLRKLSHKRDYSYDQQRKTKLNSFMLHSSQNRKTKALARKQRSNSKGRTMQKFGVSVKKLQYQELEGVILKKNYIKLFENIEKFSEQILGLIVDYKSASKKCLSRKHYIKRLYDITKTNENNFEKNKSKILEKFADFYINIEQRLQQQNQAYDSVTNSLQLKLEKVSQKLFVLRNSQNSYQVNHAKKNKSEPLQQITEKYSLSDSPKDQIFKNDILKETLTSERKQLQMEICSLRNFKESICDIFCKEKQYPQSKVIQEIQVCLSTRNKLQIQNMNLSTEVEKLKRAKTNSKRENSSLNIESQKEIMLLKSKNQNLQSKINQTQKIFNDLKQKVKKHNFNQYQTEIFIAIALCSKYFSDLTGITQSTLEGLKINNSFFSQFRIQDSKFIKNIKQKFKKQFLEEQKKISELNFQDYRYKLWDVKRAFRSVKRKLISQSDQIKRQQLESEMLKSQLNQKQEELRIQKQFQQKIKGGFIKHISKIQNCISKLKNDSMNIVIGFRQKIQLIVLQIREMGSINSETKVKILRKRQLSQQLLLEKNNIFSLQQNIQKLQTQLSFEQNKNTKLTISLQAAQSCNAKKDQQLFDMEKLNREFSVKIQDFKNLINEKEGAAQEIQEQLSLTTQQLNTLKQSLLNKEEKIQKLMKIQKDKNNEFQAFQTKEIEQLKQENSSHIKEISEYQVKLSQKNQNLKKYVRKVIKRLQLIFDKKFEQKLSLANSLQKKVSILKKKIHHREKGYRKMQLLRKEKFAILLKNIDFKHIFDMISKQEERVGKVLFQATQLRKMKQLLSGNDLNGSDGSSEQNPEVSQLQEKIANLDQLVIDLQTNILTMKGRLDETLDENNQLKLVLEQINSNFIKEKQRNINQATQIENLVEIKDENGRRITTIKKELKNTKNEVASLNKFSIDNSVQYQKKLEDVCASLKEVEERLSQKQQQLKHFKDKTEKLELEILEKEEEISGTKQKLISLQSTLSVKQSQISELKSSLKKQNEKNNEERSFIVNQMEKVETLERKMSQVQKEKEKLTLKLHKIEHLEIKEKSINLRTNRKSLQDNSLIQRQINDTNQKLQSLMEENECLRENQMQLQDELEQISKELQENTSNFEKTIQKKDDKLKKMKMKLREYKASTSNSSRAKTQKVVFKNPSGEFRDEIENLQMRNQILENNLEDKVNEFEQKFQSLEKQNLLKSNRIEILQKEIEKKNLRYSLLEDEIQSLNETVHEKDKQIKELLTEIDNLKFDKSQKIRIEKGQLYTEKQPTIPETITMTNDFTEFEEFKMLNRKNKENINVIIKLNQQIDDQQKVIKSLTNQVTGIKEEHYYQIANTVEFQIYKEEYIKTEKEPLEDNTDKSSTGFLNFQTTSFQLLFQRKEAQRAQIVSSRNRSSTKKSSQRKSINQAFQKSQTSNRSQQLSNFQMTRTYYYFNPYKNILPSLLDDKVQNHYIKKIQKASVILQRKKLQKIIIQLQKLKIEKQSIIIEKQKTEGVELTEKIIKIKEQKEILQNQLDALQKASLNRTLNLQDIEQMMSQECEEDEELEKRTNIILESLKQFFGLNDSFFNNFYDDFKQCFNSLRKVMIEYMEQNAIHLEHKEQYKKLLDVKCLEVENLKNQVKKYTRSDKLDKVQLWSDEESIENIASFLINDQAEYRMNQSQGNVYQKSEKIEKTLSALKTKNMNLERENGKTKIQFQQLKNQLKMVKRELELNQERELEGMELQQIKNSLEQFLTQFSEGSKNAMMIYDVFAQQLQCTPSEKRKYEVLFKLIKTPAKGIFGKLF